MWSSQTTPKISSSCYLMIFNILAVDEVWVALRLSSLIWCFCKNNRQCLPKTYLNIYQLVEPLTFMFVLLFSFGSFIHSFVCVCFFVCEWSSFFSLKSSFMLTFVLSRSNFCSWLLFPMYFCCFFLV